MSAQALTPSDFGRFFFSIHGTAPFPWQERLLETVAAHGEWPDVLDLPTGSGKTAALDIALFHLALEADRGVARRAPMRIAFVVDRRLIVSDAFDRASKLCQALAKPPNDLVARVATALRRLAGEDEPPLIVREMRGGVPREDDWARTPVQPVILCSTVDQVGSRLLFRGYGISDRMKPVHAGLLGSDCLILLDEAHLSEPFRQTLSALERLRRPDTAPWQVALLTATPGRPAKRPFALGDLDRANAILAPRLTARKPARLVEITGKSVPGSTDPRIERIEIEATATLRALQTDGILNPAVGIVVNRVALARALFENLRTALPNAAVTLIIGPARGVDREERRRELAPIRTRSLDEARALDRPVIVVATQTIEAGVDIDLDGIVTEAAALDALRQRFGRLNRAGRAIRAVGVIVGNQEDLGPKADDPVYGGSAAKTWAALRTLASEAADQLVDFGVEALPPRLAPWPIEELSAPQPNAPVVLPAYADLWAQTSPIPNADPEVSLFLHGPDRSPASVQIVWRADISTAELGAARHQSEVRERLTELLGLSPPRSAEAIEVPIWAARALLRQQPETLDVLSDTAERPPEEEGVGSNRLAFRYRGDDDQETRPILPEELRAGDLIVIPALYGGCDAWGWHPQSSTAATDVAENAAWSYRSHSFAVRLTPALIRQALQSEIQNDEVEVRSGRGDAAVRLPALLAAHSEYSARDLLDTILDLELPERLRDWLEALRDRARRLQHTFPYGLDAEGFPGGIVFRAPLGLDREENPDHITSASATETDELGSMPGYAQSLDEHSLEVRHYASTFTERAGLAAPVAADVALAAYLHDAGKLDPRFQAYLAGGDPLGWDETRVAAKSGRRVLPKDAQKRSGLPDRWRHEAFSVRLAQLHPNFEAANDPALVLWLIGVHHGLGRPLFPHADPLDAVVRIDLPGALGQAAWQLHSGAGPQSLAFDFQGLDWCQVFEALRRRYGIWGLARLEAFVRLADHRASEAAGRRIAEEGMQ